MESNEIAALRKEVKKILIDHGLDRYGSRDELTRILSSELGRPLNKASLCMALTGYREEPHSIEMLHAIKKCLSGDSIGEYIHGTRK